MKSLKRNETDQKIVIPILESNVIYDLDEVIPNDKNYTIIDFYMGNTDDERCVHKKGYFTSVDEAIKAVDSINADQFKSSDNDDIQWSTTKRQDVFEYYVEFSSIFLCVVISNIQNTDHVKRFQQQFKTFFEISDQDFNDGP